MEAKDTVINLDEVSNVSLKVTIEQILLEQAEISFKAGKQEVADFVNSHKLHAGNVSIPAKVWQAKIKDWGISLLS